MWLYLVEFGTATDRISGSAFVLVATKADNPDPHNTFTQNPNKSDRLIIHNKEEYSSKLVFELLKPNVRLCRIPKVAAFAIVYGNPLRLINGYDSFGNTCGTSNNEKMGGLALSGMDTSDKQCSHEILNSSDLMQGLESGHYSGCTELDYSLHTIQSPTHCRFSVIPLSIHEVQINTHINKCLQNSSSKSSSRGINYWDELYLFFMDVRHVSQSMKICVKKCPDHNLETLEDIQTFYKREHSLLCRYDFDFNLLTSQHLNEKDKNMAFSSKLGPCPSLPVYNSETGCETIPRSRSLSSGTPLNTTDPPTLHRGGYLSPSTLATSLPFSGLSEMAAPDHTRLKTKQNDTDMDYSSTDNSDMETDTDGQGTFTMADKLGRKRKFSPHKQPQTKKTTTELTNKFDADNITTTPDKQNTDDQPQATPKTRYPPIVMLGTQNYAHITKVAKEIGGDIKIT
uniref:Uncharacterized protein n=1 Tax=Timema monikensis TaxID=170555 RepID=A0A7R9EIS0_9NEOP|nr:unnamed protein product [Timema monikensis]